MQTQEKVVSAYERERGKPMPSKLHSLTEKWLTIALAQYEPAYTVFTELTLELDGNEITPDISVYPQMEIDYTHDEVRMAEPPLMTVEIMSPTQGIQDLVNKIQHMVDAGVQSCWLVQPTLKTVTVFDAEMQPKTYSEGIVTDTATDIQVTIEDIFAGG